MTWDIEQRRIDGIADQARADKEVHVRTLHRAIVIGRHVQGDITAIALCDSDDQPTRRRVKLPAARLRASWWQRLKAWFTAQDADVLCASCKGHVSLADNGVCFWCTSMRRHFTDWRDAQPAITDAASLDRLADQMRPVALPIAGPGVRQSR